MLAGKTIRLRAIEDADLALIANWRNQTHCYEFFYEFQPISIVQQRRWFENQLNSNKELNFIVALLDGTAIGTVSIYNIDRRNRRAEWGRLIIGDDQYLGKGLGLEIEYLILQYAFDHLGLNKIYCEVLSTNEPAIKLYLRFGFKREALFREHVFKSGRFIDVEVLSMLSTEYQEMKSSKDENSLLTKFRIDA